MIDRTAASAVKETDAAVHWVVRPREQVHFDAVSQIA